MNDTTTKTTMRQLLARWAEVEPTRCRVETLPDNLAEFILNLDGRAILVFTDTGIRGFWETESDSLMQIQWAVQQAIIARNWAFTARYIARYKRHLASVGFTYDQEGASQAEAILSAYLKEIEAQD